MSPKISVVIPTFERQRLTDRAVRSVLAQTRMPDEIIVVDDGSPHPYRNADRRVRVIRCELNRGAAAARNIGIRAAAGSHIAFLDSDDEWLPEKLSLQSRRLGCLEPEMSVLICGFRYCDPMTGRDAPIIPTVPRSLAEFTGGCLFNPGSTLIAPAGVFQKTGFFREGLRRLEDYEWFLRFALHGGEVETLGKILVKINKGLRPSPETVSKAVQDLGGTVDRLPKLIASRARAYLALEQASAHWYARNRLRFLAHFGRSLLHAPRLSVQLTKM